ncbi:MAG: IPTL-CTERM sorting domain-containing protein [Thermodesulfobacteriota bacterium]
MISKTINQKLIVKLYLIVISVFLFSAPSALAQVTFTTDDAVFFAQNPNLAFQDFESGNVAPGGNTSCSQTINENTNDACFSPGDILPGIEFTALLNVLVIVGPGFNNNPFVVLVPNIPPDSLDITFPGNTVNAVGVDLGCLVESLGPCSDTVFVQVFGEGDVLIGSTSVAVTSLFDSFLGIQSAEPITRINVSNAVLERFEGIDGIAFGFTEFATNIPTLSEWGMISAAVGLGLAGVWFAVRRRKVRAI